MDAERRTERTLRCADNERRDPRVVIRTDASRSRADACDGDR